MDCSGFMGSRGTGRWPASSLGRLARRPVASLLASFFALVLGLTACSGLTDVPNPSTLVDPTVVQTQDGAIGLYRASRVQFNRIFGGTNYSGTVAYLSANGLAGDEFVAGVTGAVGYYNLRLVKPSTQGDQTQPYNDLHTTRLYISEAMGALTHYAPTAPSSYRAELYAIRGYVYVMFAEMYCSGVPFSEAVYGGDVVLGMPETTEQMLTDAVAQFDSSLAISTDSTRILRLAMVGKARALLDLNRPADAAAMVTEANVPTTFSYDIGYTATTFPNVYVYGSPTSYSSPPFGMADRLGTVGLNYVSAGNGGDPRVANFTSTAYPYRQFPTRYSGGGASIPLASGIEARLIEAEAKLRAHDVAGWASILNGLRETGMSTAIPDLTADSTTTASDTLQQNVLFRERAFWLYGTGHRLGDMRRLVRQYNRGFLTVFPSGTHPVIATSPNVFSDSPVIEPPQAEVSNNPNYHGCLNHDA